MKTTQFSWSVLIAGCFFLSCNQNEKAVYYLSDFGLSADKEEDASVILAEALRKIQQINVADTIELHFEKGAYHFYPSDTNKKEYYISNHDQVNPKYVGLALENMRNIKIEGNGATFLFHGTMLPISVLNSENVSLRNFHIDFPNPHIAQVQVVTNDTLQQKILFEVAPWVKYEVKEERFFVKGHDWEYAPSSAIAFDPDTRRIVYNTSDVYLGAFQAKETAPGMIEATLKKPLLTPGTVLALRNYYRPTPGIFFSHNRNTRLENVTVHYAQGMGLLAQMCEDIYLDGFSVCLKDSADARYFTTQADATHFSSCKGVIHSRNGLYEGMMDDAINVHGTYLKIMKQVSDSAVIARYMHSQAYGFEWGRANDRVAFLDAKVMEVAGDTNRIRRIEPYDNDNKIAGAKSYLITFDKPLPLLRENAVYGIENLEWTPEVIFEHNIIRNNRARGSLFSTPKRTIVRNNLFDHTSGSAILLAGDCNGWFETGACRDILISDNRFVNALTMYFQFTNAVISVYPEIPDLASQRKYFHGGTDSSIVIENNVFETFDAPLLYAKSVDGLIFRNNKIIRNTDYKPFHWNRYPFFFEHVNRIRIEGNDLAGDFNFARDVRLTYSDTTAIEMGL